MGGCLSGNGCLSSMKDEENSEVRTLKGVRHLNVSLSCVGL